MTGRPPVVVDIAPMLAMNEQERESWRIRWRFWNEGRGGIRRIADENSIHVSTVFDVLMPHGRNQR